MLRQLSISPDLSSVDREMLTGFLVGNNGYSLAVARLSESSKQDGMSVDLKTATDDENVAIAVFTSFVAVKKKEIHALSRTMESKMGRVGDFGVKIAQMKNHLEKPLKTRARARSFTLRAIARSGCKDLHHFESSDDIKFRGTIVVTCLPCVQTGCSNYAGVYNLQQVDASTSVFESSNNLNW